MVRVLVMMAGALINAAGRRLSVIAFMLMGRMNCGRCVPDYGDYHMIRVGVLIHLVTAHHHSRHCHGVLR